MSQSDSIDRRVIHCLARTLSSLMRRDSIASRISWTITRNHSSLGITKESSIIANFANIIIIIIIVIIVVDFVMENIKSTVVVIAVTVAVVVIVVVVIVVVAAVIFITALYFTTDFRIVVAIAD